MAERKLVIHIADEPEMVDLVKLILERIGFEIIGAFDAREGLKAVRKLKPDLVFLDLMMQDGAGREVYQHLKADDELKTIPLIVIFHKAQRIDKVIGGLPIAKQDDYVVAPFGPQEFLQTVSKVLGEDVW